MRDQWTWRDEVRLWVAMAQALVIIVLSCLALYAVARGLMAVGLGFFVRAAAVAVCAAVFWHVFNNRPTNEEDPPNA